MSERLVLFYDINKSEPELSIKLAVDKFRTLYGEPRRVWVNAKDVPDTIVTVSDMKVERRGGCARGKVMVM